MNHRNVLQIVQQAQAIEEDSAREAGALGYMARVMIQATMPHSRPDSAIFERSNGNFSLAMMAHPSVGLPYGPYPRLLLAWITTEAARTKEYVLVLGPTLSGFMAQLGLLPTGGRWGTIYSLRDRMQRLFTCSISCVYKDDIRQRGTTLHIAHKYDLWWEPKQPEQASLWQSTVTLTTEFFNEIITRPVPIDMRALRALKQSPMALDIYCWLTYRMSYLKAKTQIPWEVLQQQFGAGYGTDPQGVRDFRKKFRRHLLSVCVVYPEANVDEANSGIVLLPSRPHVPLLPNLPPT